MRNLDEFQKKIGYEFRDEALLVRALTHTSYGGNNNQRLEFLGDAVLGVYAAKALFERKPPMKEGEMSRARAASVCESSLFEASKAFDLGDYLLLGRGEEQGGGRKKPSIVSDAFEALIAAVYIDGGSAEADRFMRRFVPLVTDGRAEATDPKTRLQERLQKDGAQRIRYATVGESGPDHDKRFTVEVSCEDVVLGKGGGHSKKEAEQAAARSALARLEKNGDYREWPCARKLRDE